MPKIVLPAKSPMILPAPVFGKAVGVTGVVGGGVGFGVGAVGGVGVGVGAAMVTVLVQAAWMVCSVPVLNVCRAVILNVPDEL